MYFMFIGRLIMKQVTTVSNELAIQETPIKEISSLPCNSLPVKDII